MEVANGELVLADSLIHDSGSTGAPVIRAENSHITLKSARIRTKALEYGTLIDCRNSNLHVRDCHFETTAPVVSSVAVSGGRGTFINTEIVITPERAGRALECWGAKLVIAGLRLVRTGNDESNGDTALWIDRNTVVISEKELEVTGFRFKKKTGAH